MRPLSENTRYVLIVCQTRYVLIVCQTNLRADIYGTTPVKNIVKNYNILKSKIIILKVKYYLKSKIKLNIKLQVVL